MRSVLDFSKRRLFVLLVLLAVISSFMVVESRKAWALSPSIGWLDSWSIVGGGYLHLTGWALTSDYPTTSLGIRVRVDGASITNWYQIANTYRPDVGAAYPGYGNYHGFDIYAAVPVSDYGGGYSGSHSICVEAQNSGVYTTLSGCTIYSMGSGSYFGGRFDLNPGNLLNLGYYVTGSYGGDIAAGGAEWNNSTAYNRSYPF